MQSSGIAVMAGVLALAAPAVAQDNEHLMTEQDRQVDEVLGMLDAMFLAFHAQDLEGLQAALAEDAGVVRRVQRGDDGEGATVSASPLSEWAANVAGFEGELMEVYWDPVVQISLDTMAGVWAPYDLRVNGETAQCGINHFSIVREGDAWKIADITYSVEPGSCDVLRPDAMEDYRPATLVHDFLLTE